MKGQFLKHNFVLFLIVLLTLLFIVLTLLKPAKVVLAQEEFEIVTEDQPDSETEENETIEDSADSRRGIIITPAIVNLVPGQKYSLKIENKSETELSFDIQPSVFAINTMKRAVYRIETPQDFLQNYKNYIDFDNTSHIIQPEGDIEIEVTYKGEYQEYIIGISVMPVTPGLTNNEVNLGANLGSIILDTSISDADLERIATSLQVIPKNSFLSLSISDTYNLTTSIENNTAKIIKSNGEIYINAGGKIQERILLSTELLQALYPNEKKILGSIYTDKRGFLEEIGTIKFRNIIEINGRTIVVERSVFQLPVWLLIIILLILTVILVLVVRKGLRHRKYLQNRKIALSNQQV